MFQPHKLKRLSGGVVRERGVGNMPRSGCQDEPKASGAPTPQNQIWRQRLRLSF